MGPRRGTKRAAPAGGAAGGASRAPRVSGEDYVLRWVLSDGNDAVLEVSGFAFPPGSDPPPAPRRVLTRDDDDSAREGDFLDAGPVGEVRAYLIRRERFVQANARAGYQTFHGAADENSDELYRVSTLFDRHGTCESDSMLESPLWRASANRDGFLHIEKVFVKPPHLASTGTSRGSPSAATGRVLASHPSGATPVSATPGSSSRSPRWSARPKKPRWSSCPSVEHNLRRSLRRTMLSASS